MSELPGSLGPRPGRKGQGSRAPDWSTCVSAGTGDRPREVPAVSDLTSLASPSGCAPGLLGSLQNCPCGHRPYCAPGGKRRGSQLLIASLVSGDQVFQAGTLAGGPTPKSCLHSQSGTPSVSHCPCVVANWPFRMESPRTHPQPMALLQRQ